MASRMDGWDAGNNHTSGVIVQVLTESNHVMRVRFFVLNKYSSFQPGTSPVLACCKFAVCTEQADCC